MKLGVFCSKIIGITTLIFSNFITNMKQENNIEKLYLIAFILCILSLGCSTQKDKEKTDFEIVELMRVENRINSTNIGTFLLIKEKLNNSISFACYIDIKNSKVNFPYIINENDSFYYYIFNHKYYNNRLVDKFSVEIDYSNYQIFVYDQTLYYDGERHRRTIFWNRELGVLNLFVPHDVNNHLFLYKTNYKKQILSSQINYMLLKDEDYYRFIGYKSSDYYSHHFTKDENTIHTKINFDIPINLYYFEGYNLKIRHFTKTDEAKVF